MTAFKRLRSRTPLLVAAGLALLVLVVLYGTAAGSEGEPAGPDSVPVRRGAIVSTVSADGRIDSPRELGLDFERPGRLARVYVIEGERVRRGQVLARIDSEQARESYRAARSGLESARERLADTRAGRNLIERERNDELAEQSRVAVLRAERDLADARRVGAANVGGLRRAVVRARVSGEVAVVRASRLRLAREITEVRENRLRYRRLEELLDRLRADLDVLRDEQNDRLNRQADASSRRGVIEGELQGARQELAGDETAAAQARVAADQACAPAPPSTATPGCDEAREEERRAEDELEEAGDRVRRFEEELDEARREEIDSTQQANNRDFAVQSLQTRIFATERDEGAARQDLQTSRTTARQLRTEVDGNVTTLREARRQLGDQRDSLVNGIAQARQSINQARSSLDGDRAALGVTLATSAVDEQPADAAMLAAGRAAVASARSATEDAEEGLEDTVLRAPMDGVAARVDAEIGELVGSGAPSSGGGSGGGAPGGSDAGGGGSGGAPAPGSGGASPAPGGPGGASPQTPGGSAPGGGGMGGAPGGGAAGQGGAPGGGAQPGGGGAPGGGGSSGSGPGGAGGQPGGAGASGGGPGASTGSGGSTPTALAQAPGGGPSASGSSAGGSTVAASGSGGGSLLTLTQLTRLQVKSDFSETDAAQLRVGEPATVAVDALPGRRYGATVAAIDPLETTTGGVVRYEVTFVVEDDQVGLRPGMTAEVAAEVARSDDTLVVPRTAVRSPLGTNPSVMVAGPGGRQELRIVATGLQNGREVQILAGVGLGERVLRSLAPPPDPGAFQ